MTDMYKPPESDLGVNRLVSNRPHVMWRVFFWLNAAMLLLIVFVLAALPGLSILDYVDMAVFGFVVTGLYSYSYSKKILSPIIWKISCLLYILWFVFYEIAGPLLIDMTHYGEPAVLDGFILLSLLFFVPTAYVLYMLGYKTK
jgi:hypothetical protein